MGEGVEREDLWVAGRRWQQRSLGTVDGFGNGAESTIIKERVSAKGHAGKDARS